VNLVGVWNAVFVPAKDMIERGQGGAIVLTSSTQGLTGRGADGSAGALGYAAAKHGVVGLMRSFANWLSPHGIRVNSVHPTGVATPMVLNEVLGKYVEDNPEAAKMVANLMPVDLVEPVDISNAVHAGRLAVEVVVLDQEAGKLGVLGRLGETLGERHSGGEAGAELVADRREHR
jgi:NAD(P)-dependent dehydrogenase (short-subunit alcohol dehydrogenase family)